jgi:hypothetical protein
MRQIAILITATAILFAIPAPADAVGSPPTHTFLDPGFDFWLLTLDFEGAAASAQSSDVALVVTPAGVTLTEDHAAVIAAGSDEFGVAGAVCLQQGAQPLLTELISVFPLEAGDRLTDFVEVDFDPETGETMYACRVIY